MKVTLQKGGWLAHPPYLLLAIILTALSVGCSSDEEQTQQQEQPRIKFVDPSLESDTEEPSVVGSKSVGQQYYSGSTGSVDFAGGGFGIMPGVEIPKLEGREKAAYVQTLTDLEDQEILRKAPEPFQGVLPLTFTSTSDCVVGDIDIISGHVVRTGAARLLLTLESLHPRGRKQPYYATQIMPEQLKEGFDINVPITADRIPLHLGLFICGDSGATNNLSCKGKMVTNMPAMSVVYRPVNPYKPQVKFYPDTVFVFHYLTYDADSMRVLARIAKDQDIASLGFAVALQDDDDEGLEEALTLANNYTQAAKSLPIKFQLGRYVVDLPHFDMNKCPKDVVPPVR